MSASALHARLATLAETLGVGHGLGASTGVPQYLDAIAPALGTDTALLWLAQAAVSAEFPESPAFERFAGRRG